MARLLDEDATDWYASMRRAAEERTPDPAGEEIAEWRKVWAATESPDPDPDRIRAWRR